MITKGKSERKFTAPAGSLTLLRASGWGDRLDLLGRLELSRYEGLDLLIDIWEEPCGATKNPARRRPMGGWSELDAKHALFVTDSLARWLHTRPKHPMMIGPDSVEAIVAMACGWSTALTHALAEGPKTFEELYSEVTALYDEDGVSEHLDLMVNTGQAERFQDPGQPHRFRLTEWGTRALSPLIAAARRESYLPDEDIMPPEIVDIETAFALTLPVLELPRDLVGTCHLCVHVEGAESLVAGAKAVVGAGGVLATSVLLESEPENWVKGTAREWCDIVVDPTEAKPLASGGDTEISSAIIAALHKHLFDDPRRGRLAPGLEIL